MPVCSFASTNIAKNATSHDIAIVYDTSGSMFDETDYWCQALYAVEVFASMLDYDSGDKLGIYAMDPEEHPIRVGKDGKDAGARLEITKDNIQDIENIYVPRTSWTIFEPVYTASDYLKSSDADEKWLIVLTDGEFNKVKAADEVLDKAIEAKWIEDELKKISKDSNGKIKVQYLGFSDAVSLQPDEANGLYATRASSAEALTNNLVDICNKIFQRDAIALNNGHFSSDVSLKTVVAFAQGENASINSLTSSDGDTVDKVNNIDLHAGTFGAGGYNFKKANISGQVVTFGPCVAGEYDLDYSGNNIQAFYEPNVEAQIRLKDEDGNEVDASKGVYPGEYIVEYGLVDFVTGEDVSNSGMLSPVEIGATVENNGTTTEISSGDRINLEADSNTFIHVKGTYLDKYSFETDRDDQDSIGHIIVNNYPEKELKTKLSTKQKQNYYQISRHESWEPIRLDVTYDGRKLSDEEMQKLDVSIDPSPSENYSYTMDLIPGESAYNITLGRNNRGEYVEPEYGFNNINQLKSNVTLTDEYNRKITDESKISFEFHVLPPEIHRLLWLIILAIIVATIVFILTRKAWPRRITYEVQDRHGNIIKQGRIDPGEIMNLNHGDGHGDVLKCHAEKASNVWSRLRGRGEILIEIEPGDPGQNIQRFEVLGQSYRQVNQYKAQGDSFSSKVGGGQLQIKTVHFVGRNSTRSEYINLSVR